MGCETNSTGRRRWTEERNRSSFGWREWRRRRPQRAVRSRSRNKLTNRRVRVAHRRRRRHLTRGSEVGGDDDAAAAHWLTETPRVAAHFAVVDQIDRFVARLC